MSSRDPAETLRSLDMNLFVALDALLSSRSVSKAAKLLGLSQSATSHALARLRDALGDQVLVRAKGGMVATPYAASIALPVRRALTDLAQAAEGQVGFDPESTERTFVIATLDYAEVAVLPLVVRDRAGDNIQYVTERPDRHLADRLEDGSVDVAIGTFHDTMLPHVMQRHLFDGTLDCLVRRDHPTIKSRMTLPRYVAGAHVMVHYAGAGPGPIKQVLDARGLERRVLLSVSSFASIPFIVADSDLIATVPTQVAIEAERYFPVRQMRLPFELPRFSVRMYWHPRFDGDAAHQWLREMVVTTTQQARQPKPATSRTRRRS